MRRTTNTKKQPVGKTVVPTSVDLKEEIVKATEHPKDPKAKNIAKQREESEQPVHVIKKSPKS